MMSKRTDDFRHYVKAAYGIEGEEALEAFLARPRSARRKSGSSLWPYNPYKAPVVVRRRRKHLQGLAFNALVAAMLVFVWRKRGHGR